MKPVPDGYILSFGSQAGGVETWIRDFLHFTEAEYQLLPRQSISSPVFSAEGLKSPMPGPLRANFKALSATFGLVGELLRLRNEAVPLHAHNLRLALAAIFLARSTELIYFSHNNFGRQLANQHLLKKKGYFLAERFVLKKSNKVFTFSKEDLSRMSKYRSDIELLQGSFNDELFPLESPTDFFPRAGLVWVGRLSPVKNPILAIQAFELLPEKHKSQLTIIGDGPLHKKLAGIASRSTDRERITFAGFLPPKQVRLILERSEVLLVTSHSEGPTPRNVYEAIASGVRVVSTNPGDPNSVVEATKAGIVCEDPTAQSVAEAIQKCLSSAEAPKVWCISGNRASVFFPRLENQLLKTQKLEAKPDNEP